MANWDSAQTAFLTAAAKTYAALKVAHPSGNYGSGIWVTLNIDGTDYQCRCDCTGVIQCIIRVMGYDPNWGVSSVAGHTGDGWYITDATGPFVKDKDGNISPDWEVVPFDASDARPGDIRAASGHSHCDIFVDYKNGNAYGLNAGSGPNTGGQAIPKSCAAGEQYLQDGNPDDLAATWTIQDDEAAKVLRYVNGSQQTPSSTGTSAVSGGQSLQSLDIDLKFIQRTEFWYALKDNTGEFKKVIPGYFNKSARIVPDGTSIVTDSYGDSWLEFLANYTKHWLVDSEYEIDKELEKGIIMMYTLDNSDPLQYGRTIYLHDDGTNDYERSVGIVPIIRTQFPVHFRCVLTDADTHTKDFGRSSAYFTNDTSGSLSIGEVSIADVIRATKNAMFLTDASGKSPECEDAHGYLFLHDEDSTYDKESYEIWVRGMKEE